MSSKKRINFANRKLELILRSDADKSVCDEVFIDKDYKILEPIIQKADFIIDIGAHIGLFSIYASLLNPDAQILAFEPAADNFETLRANLKNNKISNVKAKNLAVSDQVGEQILYLSDDSHNHSLLSQTDTKCTVNSSTLDKILSKHQKCPLIKMDCEGAEFLILPATSPETFKKISYLYLEYHEDSDQLKKEKLLALLQSNKFKTKVYPSNYQKNLGFIVAHK